MSRTGRRIVFPGHAVGLLLLLGLSFVSAQKEAGAVKSSDGEWEIVTEKSAGNHAAWGKYDNSINEKGWAQIHVKASEGFSDNDQMFAAGYVEGYLTRKLILAFHQNTKADHDALRPQLINFMKTQDSYLREEVAKNNDDVFWIQTGLVLQQLDGLLQGYNDSVENDDDALTLEELWIINMDGDLIELETALGKDIDVTGVPCGGKHEESEATTGLRFQHLGSSVSSAAEKPALRWQNSLLRTLSQHAVTSKVGEGEGGSILAPDANPLRFARTQTQTKTTTRVSAQRQEELNAKFTRLMKRARCTAVVKLTEDRKDILMAHNSWEDYVEMLRVFKHYQFHLSDAAKMAAPRSSFSSYPGMLSSTDDFYMMSSGLAVIETTVNLMDDSLLEKMCAKNGIASWVRSIVANRVATTGEEWADAYSRLNSGTYNCQWMITDYNLLEKANNDGGGDLLPGTFWIVETVPGFSHKQDMTTELQRRSYWPSANRPYFPETRAESGYPLNPNIPDGSTAEPHVVGMEGESDPIGEDMGLEGTSEQKAATTVLPPLKCPEECDDLVSFENNPRGAVLRKHAAGPWPASESMASMKKLMRLNGWNEDGGDGMSTDASVAVAARYDLLEFGKMATGAVDAKIVNAAGMKDMTAQVIGGPTHQDHPAFNFDDWPEIPHAEMPSEWNFDWFEAKGFSGDSKVARFQAKGLGELEFSGDRMGGNVPIVAEAVL